MIKRTVRCQGVNVDRKQGGDNQFIDVPALLQKHFPEHGPYLGVYAQCASEGVMRVGGEVRAPS